MLEFSVLKTRVLVSPMFFAVLTLFLIADKNGIANNVVLFSLIHESGHFMALICCKTYPKEIRIDVFGIRILLPRVLCMSKKIAILASGFITNFITAAALYFMDRKIEFYINLILGIFTALPIKATDGGEIVSVLFSELNFSVSEKRIKKALAFFTVFIGLIIMTFSVFTKNIYLILAAAYIIIISFK